MKSLNRMDTTGKTARESWEDLKSSISDAYIGLCDLHQTLTNLSNDSKELAELCDAMGHGWIDLTESLDKVIQYSEPQNE